MEDPDLQPLLGFPSNEKAEHKRKLAVARIFNNFASIYDLWQLGGMPNDIWRTFEADLKLLVSRPEFTSSWANLKQFHDPKFVGLVDWLIRENAREKGTKS